MTQTLEEKNVLQQVENCLAEMLAQNVTSFRDVSNERCNQTMTVEIQSYTPPLLETHFLLAVIYCCVVGVALCVGTFGNLVILAISATTRTMNRFGRDFVINMALADLCVAAVADPMCILGVLKGEHWFQGRWLLCEVVASMCLTACFCAFLNLTLLTFNRYVFVCWHTWYYRIFKRPVCIFLCVCAWVLAFLFEYPNFIGWGDHYFDSKNHQCIWDRTASFSYTLVVAVGLIGGPLLLMAVGYLLIFYSIYKSKRDVFSLNTDDPLRVRRIWQESWRSSKTLFIIFMAFVICWTPYAVIIAIDVKNVISMETHLLVTLLAHLHSSLNFTIYFSSNETFRRSVLTLLSCSLTSWKYRGSSETHKTIGSSDIKSSDVTKSVSDISKDRHLISGYIPAVVTRKLELCRSRDKLANLPDDKKLDDFSDTVSEESLTKY